MVQAKNLTDKRYWVNVFDLAGIQSVPARVPLGGPPAADIPADPEASWSDHGPDR